MPPLITVKERRKEAQLNSSMGQSRFKLRHAVVGYVVALVFAFNGLLAGVIDASVASGGGSLSIITCLGGETQGQVPGPDGHAAKCLCSLSCCCAGGVAGRTSGETDISYPVANGAVLRRSAIQIVRDFRADHPLHVRSPPAVNSRA
jgi:hypothetical protein